MSHHKPGDSLASKNDCQSAIEALMPRGYPTIEQVADYQVISVRKLQRRLREANVPCSAMVGRVRQDLAYQKLETTNLPIEEVARDLGFRDHSSFSRAFRRCAGMSPGDYRRSQQEASDRKVEKKANALVCRKQERT